MRDVIRPVVICLGATALAYLLAATSLRSWERGAAATSALIACVFTYGISLTAFRQSSIAWLANAPGQFLWYWGFGAAVVVVLAGWKWTFIGSLTRFLNAASLILVGIVITGTGFSLASTNGDLTHIRQAEPSAAAARSQGLPDIYYVILDAYGREDALRHYFGYSNGNFLNELRKRGFYVANNSFSNYCQTELSLASSLNLNWASALFKSPPAENDRKPLDRLIDRSYVADFLRGQGYQYVAVASGFPGIEPQSADTLVSDSSGYTLFEASLLSTTPLRELSAPMEGMYDQRRAKLLAAFRHLIEMAPRAARPRFFLVHILAPHPPFVFGPNGEPLKPKMPFGFWDASAYFAVGGTQRDYQQGYVGQLQFVNRQMLRVVDAIMKSSSTPPVVILQGDHGSRSRLSQETLQASDVRECFRNLDAFLVPPAVRRLLYPGITPVNSFRLLFNGLFGTKFEKLPDRCYYTSWDKPYQPIDVTSLAKAPL